MKALTRILFLAGACSFVAVGVASAQMVTPMKFHAPVAFYVGSTVLPPGTYVIEPRVNTPGAIEVSGPSVSVPLAVESVVSTGAPAVAVKNSAGQVTFTRIENEYVLGEVWDNVNRLGVEGTTAAFQHAARGDRGDRVPETLTVPATRAQ